MSLEAIFEVGAAQMSDGKLHVPRRGRTSDAEWTITKTKSGTRDDMVSTSR